MTRHQFVTTGGAELVLRPVNNLLLERFQSEWEKRHPAPRPMLVKLSNGEYWPDRNEDTYQVEFAAWLRMKNNAYMDFIFDMGIASEPPANWKTDFPLQDEANRKTLWIYSLIPPADGDEENSELMQLVEAIISQTQVTKKAVEEEEKN